jgi:hypothetical protein
MVEAFGQPFEHAAGCGSGRGIALAMTAHVVVVSLAPLPGYGGVVVGYFGLTSVNRRTEDMGERSTSP